MSTAYDEFLPEVLPYVHDCAYPVAINAVRNACIEFCDKTDYVTYTHDPISVVAGTASYNLVLPAGTEVARILSGWYDGLRMAPKGEEDMRLQFPLDWRTMTGRPQYFTHAIPSTVIVVPAPQTDATDALKFIIALRPSRASTTIDDVIYSRFAEQIGWGARSRLYETPNQPYYDPQSAALYRARFQTAIGGAKIERNYGLTRGPLHARPPRIV